MGRALQQQAVFVARGLADNIALPAQQHQIAAELRHRKFHRVRPGQPQKIPVVARGNLQDKTPLP